LGEIFGAGHAYSIRCKPLVCKGGRRVRCEGADLLWACYATSRSGSASFYGRGAIPPVKEADIKQALAEESGGKRMTGTVFYSAVLRAISRYPARKECCDV
jgi:hypothetical protein